MSRTSNRRVVPFAARALLAGLAASLGAALTGACAAEVSDVDATLGEQRQASTYCNGAMPELLNYWCTFRPNGFTTWIWPGTPSDGLWPCEVHALCFWSPVQEQGSCTSRGYAELAPGTDYEPVGCLTPDEENRSPVAVLTYVWAKTREDARKACEAKQPKDMDKYAVPYCNGLLDKDTNLAWVSESMLCCPAASASGKPRDQVAPAPSAPKPAAGVE